MRRQETNEIDPMVETIRSELNRHKGEWPRLATLLQHHNSRLSYRWLLAFASRQIADPSFTRIRLLGSYLGVKLVPTPGKHFNHEGRQ